MKWLRVLLGLWVATSVFAEEPMCCKDHWIEGSHLQLGGSYTHARITPYGFNNYNGNLAGAQGLYEFRLADRIYGGAFLRWREGKETGQLGTMTFTDWNAQERIGYTVGNKKNLFSLFTGFGFRYLAQQDQPKISSPITFDYQEFYVPVGFLYDYKVSSCFSWGLYATWMPQVYPTVTIYPMGGARWMLVRTFKNGIVEMPFTFFSERFDTVSLMIKPFAEYWQDGKTTAVSSTGVALGVPRNTYLFVGVDVNLCYSF